MGFNLLSFAFGILSVSIFASYAEAHVQHGFSGSGSASGSGSGSGSGFGIGFMSCPMQTLLRDALLDSDQLTIPLISTLDLNTQDYVFVVLSDLQFTLSTLRSVSFINITESVSGVFLLLSADDFSETEDSLLVTIDIMFSVSGFQLDTCMFSVLVRTYETSICTNSGAGEIERERLFDESVEITVEGTLTADDTSVLQDLQDFIANLLNTLCPSACASCGLLQICDVYFDLCNDSFSRSDVEVLDISPSADTSTTLLTISVAYHLNLPLLEASSLAIPAETLAQLLQDNTANVGAATGLNVLGVETNESPTEEGVDVVVIVVPVVVAMVVIAIVATIATVVGIILYKKHQSKVAPQQGEGTAIDK